MSTRTRRRSDAASEAGTDSFLDILANLVGILVILVVVVAIRVRQTVPEVAVPEPPPTLEDRPLDVAFAPPAPDRAADPEPSVSLLAEVRSLSERRDALSAEVDAMPPDVEVPDPSGFEALRLELDALRAETAETIALTTARAADAGRLEAVRGRLVRELEDLEQPPVKVETLQHEVRSLARAASIKQLYLHLERGHLTVLPSDELVKRAVRHQRTNLKVARYDGVYTGSVGPIDGVTLNYEARRSAASAMDLATAGPSAASVSQYWFEVSVDADREPIGRAVEPGSQFRRTLASAPAGTTLTCIVKPDSYLAARTLQNFLQRRSQRVAFLPTPADLPAIFSPGGVRVMTQ